MTDSTEAFLGTIVIVILIMLAVVYVVDLVNDANICKEMGYMGASKTGCEYSCETPLGSTIVRVLWENVPKVDILTICTEMGR